MTRTWRLLPLGLLTGLCFLLALKVGSVPVSWAELWGILSNHGSGDTAQIVYDLRLPRALLALLVGGALALAGTTFQALLRNPLADPYIVGTSAGAAVGAALSIVLSRVGVPIDRTFLAFVGAVTTMFCVYRLAWVGGRLPVETFLLAGVVVGAFLWALVSLLLILARERMQEVIFYLMGDLSTATMSDIGLIAPHLLVGVVILFAMAHRLNLMTLGEDSAFHLGVPVEGLKIGLMTVASLLTAATVSVCGLIGFVGLVVPHVTRRLVGADHRVLLPAAALAGGCFLLLADTASRSVLTGQELPVGIVTSLMGGPFFLVLLARRRSVR